MRVLQLIHLTAILLLLARPAFADAQNTAADYCDQPTMAGAVAYYNTSCANSWLGQGNILRNIVPYSDAANTDPQSSADFVLGGSTAEAATDPTMTGSAGHAGAY